MRKIGELIEELNTGLGVNGSLDLRMLNRFGTKTQPEKC
jgi:hypothetical protein